MYQILFYIIYREYKPTFLVEFAVCNQLILSKRNKSSYIYLYTLCEKFSSNFITSSKFFSIVLDF